jgi:hypothetical protein
LWPNRFVTCLSCQGWKNCSYPKKQRSKWSGMRKRNVIARTPISHHILRMMRLALHEIWLSMTFSSMTIWNSSLNNVVYDDFRKPILIYDRKHKNVIKIYLNHHKHVHLNNCDNFFMTIMSFVIFFMTWICLADMALEAICTKFNKF